MLESRVLVGYVLMIPEVIAKDDPIPLRCVIDKRDVDMRHSRTGSITSDEPRVAGFIITESRPEEVIVPCPLHRWRHGIDYELELVNANKDVDDRLRCQSRHGRAADMLYATYRVRWKVRAKLLRLCVIERRPCGIIVDNLDTLSQDARQLVLKALHRSPWTNLTSHALANDIAWTNRGLRIRLKPTAPSPLGVRNARSTC